VTNLAPAAAIGWGLFITAAQYYGCFGGVGGLLAGAVVADCIVLGLEGRESVVSVGFDYVILDTATLRSSLWPWLNEYVPHCPAPSGLVMVNRDFPVGVPATGDVRRNAPGFVARMSVSPR
jgi:hypothetical protein